MVLLSTGTALGFVTLMGSRAGLRAWKRERAVPEEWALVVAWLFAAGAIVWFFAYLQDSRLLGFGEPWNWLAAAHFAVAGYGALTVTALTCRAVGRGRSLLALRLLLFVHPIAYFITAAGISGFSTMNALGAVIYEALFLTQLVAYCASSSTRMNKGPKRLLLLSLGIPVVTLLFSNAWAWRHLDWGISAMVRHHGVVNAVGHVGLGFLAFAWGRPAAHALPRL